MNPGTLLQRLHPRRLHVRIAALGALLLAAVVAIYTSDTIRTRTATDAAAGPPPPQRERPRGPPPSGGELVVQGGSERYVVWRPIEAGDRVGWVRLEYSTR